MPSSPGDEVDLKEARATSSSCKANETLKGLDGVSGRVTARSDEPCCTDIGLLAILVQNLLATCKEID